MPHPLHDFLMRWLETEQCAFDAEARHDWPWESRESDQDTEGELDDGYGEPQASS